MLGKSTLEGILREEEISSVVSEALDTLPVDGKRVLILIPDGTRSMPMPLMFDLLSKSLERRVKALDFLVALGTHPPMNDAQLSNLVGQPVSNGKAGLSRIYNHAWDVAENLKHVGMLDKRTIERITDGMMSQEVSVQLNKLIFDYDQIIICGPVFPHEVVGFSGGNKYLFPGIAGADLIDFTHWLGALITSYEIIGKGYTPVRAVIDAAAALIDKAISCFSLVVAHQGLAAIFFGQPQESWQAAVAVSAQKHVVYVKQAYQRVISIMPAMYDDLWTAAKGMYKMEPVVADRGEVIILAPHITEVSYTHGKTLDQIGYHCRDYFLEQWEKYKDYPHGVLGHSTHVKGLGQYDPITGIETPRIIVTLATNIPEERCSRINLGYMNPLALDLEQLKRQADETTLIVPRAGEMLYRLRKPDSIKG